MRVASIHSQAAWGPQPVQRTPLEVCSQVLALDRSGISPQVRLAVSQTTARRSLLEKYGIYNPPEGWENMPLADFLRLAQTRRSPQESPLQVRAYAYLNAEGASVPVRSVRIHETDHYNAHNRYHNPARYGRFEHSHSQGQLGRTYTVTVEWEDGRTQVTQVKNRGWPVEIW